MAYGLSKNEFLLKEGNLFIGAYTPANITVTAPFGVTAWTSTGNIGYIKMGTIAPTITRAYTEFRAGTPSKSIRKDLIQKDLKIGGTLAQYNADLLALVQGLDVQSGTYIIGWVGSDEPTAASTRYGFRLQTARVDGKEFDVAIFSGQVVSEEVGPTLPGTEHSTYQLMIDAFEAPYYEANPDDTRNYGMIVIEA